MITVRGSQETLLHHGVYVSCFSSADVIFTVLVAVFVRVVEKQLVQNRHTSVYVNAVPLEIRTVLH